MNGMLAGRGPRGSGDEGMALVMTMGAVVVIGALILAALSLSTVALRSSTAHRYFESSLAAAEAGIDETLGKVSVTYNSSPIGTVYTSPAPCNVAAPTAAQVATPDAERAWARDALLALPTSCTVSTAGGDYVAVRPEGRQAVYAMGWFPSRTAQNSKRRLVKAEYIFAPFSPGKAILVSSALDFSGSVTVNNADPSLPADVHTNASVTTNSSMTVSGSISASGTVGGGCPAGVADGCVSGAPLESIPVPNPRSVYNDYATTTDQWFDLCTGAGGGYGQVRRPAVWSSPTDRPAPCTGALVTNVGGGSAPTVAEFNGWTFTPGSGTTPPVWTLPKTSGSYPGAYYVYQANAVIGGNGVLKDDRFVTVMAESAPTGGTSTSCGKYGGNIEWKLFSLRPYLSGLVLMAQANLTGGANADAGSGLFMAGDKIDLNTSSATITGAVVAANSCAAAGPNTVQGVTIMYDQNVETPVNDMIRTTLWLEYQSR